MKSKIATFILFIIMILLLGIIGGVVWLVYSGADIETIIETFQEGDISTIVEQVTDSLNGNDTSENATNTNSNTSSTNKVTSSGTSTNTSDLSDNFYYSQLSDTQKIIYEALNENKENMKTGTYKIEFGDQFTDILEQEDGATTLGDDYQAAIDAYTHDNPDLFYIDVSKMYLSIETTTRVLSKTYNVYIAPKDNETYYDDAFSSQAEVVTAIAEVEYIKDEILKNISDDDYYNIKLIHNYLIDNVEYDSNYESVNPYSIYGTLVQGQAVCEGYSRTFKYLLNAAGIECELVQGSATNSEGTTQSHAWNIVYLEGKWYYVDTTWDDPVVIGNGILTDKYRYQYFLKGSKTFEKDHIEETQFVENGKEFYYPTASEDDY